MDALPRTAPPPGNRTAVSLGEASRCDISAGASRLDAFRVAESASAWARPSGFGKLPATITMFTGPHKV
jgi:hypothetical protein